MSQRLIIPLGAIGFVLLCVACVLVHARSIEQDLRSRTTSALTAAGIHGADLTLSGRDVTLTGTVGSQELVQLAGQTVIGQRGVRMVDNRLQFAGPVSALDEYSREPRSREEFQRGLDEQLVGKTIEFESGSAIISSQGRLVLDGLLPLIKAHRGARVEIGGHTDSRGSDESNLDLSQRRAAAVKQFLVEHGVEPSRLTAVGYGETSPIAGNDTLAGRGENRRITFNVLEGS